MNTKNKNKNIKESNFADKNSIKESKRISFFNRHGWQIFIIVGFIILLVAAFSTVYNSFFNNLQYEIFSKLRIPFSNIYFMNFKLAFPNFFAINLLVMIVVLVLFFALYLKKINAIKNWDDFTNKLLFSIIVSIIYFLFLGFVFLKKFIILQVILFFSLLLYFFIFALYLDKKNNINLSISSNLAGNEVKILVFYSFLILILYIFDYKSWKYSYIGDEWAFFEYAKGIIDGKVPLQLFSENGVYGYHPVLSSIWQALIMFITDKGLFGWKLSSALIVPLSIIPFYIWNKMVFNRTVAIIALIVFTMSNAMMAFGHIGYNNIQPIFFYITVLCMLEIAMRKHSSFYFIIASLLMGLGFYTFYSSRLIVVIAVLYVVLHPERKKFKISEFILPMTLYLIIISPLVLTPDFFLHMLKQTAMAGSEIKKTEERPIYFVLNFVHSFWAFITKSKNTHFMIDGLLDIFSAIGVLTGLIWTFVAIINDWRAKFLVITYFFLVLFIGALHQYHYPVNTRLIFLVPLLATLAGVGLSRLAVLITFFKRSRSVYLITIILFCFIVFIINCVTFYIKMPNKLRFTTQAYLIKFLQDYKKNDKFIVTSSEIVNLKEIMIIYNLNNKVNIIDLPQFEIMLKQGDIQNKVIIFDANTMDKENRLKRFVKPGYTYSDNESGKILFYIFDFLLDNNYYNGFYELWTTGKTSYVIKNPVNESKNKIKKGRKVKDISTRTINYKINGKIQKFEYVIYKNFQFEKTYSAMRNSEVKNFIINKLTFDKQFVAPTDIAFDIDSNIIFIADSKERKILKFGKIKEDMFILNASIDIPGRFFDEKKVDREDILFLDIEPEKKILYILDSAEGKIFEADYLGSYLSELVSSDHIKYSTGISLDKNNKQFIISNPEENMIMILNISGNLKNTYCTTRGMGEGQMNRPVSSVFTKDNYILVADSLNGKVLLFDNNIKYVRNYRIGICSHIQWPDIEYIDHPLKPFFAVTQPEFKKIYFFLLNEDAFRYARLDNFKNIKFLNPSKLVRCKNGFYLLDNVGKFVVRLQMQQDFMLEKIDFPFRR